ncbi:MAG: PilC/PilY family type IV pilus protein, partial [Thermoanaerobaculia bacterium]
INANGLSSPTLIDYNGDGKVDIAYAGDLNGNLWRFNLMAASPAAWGVAYGGQPLFQTALVGGVRQAITTAPEVGRHPDSGVMVYIATGRLLSIADGIDKTTQAAYGIWDNNWAAGVPIDPLNLLAQQLKGVQHISGKATRVATNNQPDWTVHRGWMTPTQIAAASSLDQGERVIQDLMLRDGRVSLMTVNPTIPTGENWFIQLDAITGGAPRKTIIDVNADFLLNVADNVDGNGDLVVADVPEDRVVGEYQNFGLASRPVAGVLSAGKDAALINHLVAVTPVPPAIVGDPLDPGLLGGHFDLDTSHLTYPFSGGQTDGHVHQWDDKHNRTTIDFFALPDGNGNPLYEITSNVFGIQPNETFILTVANDNLSPGGVLEINGSSVSVGDYRAVLQRYLSGTLLPGETFPRYKLSNPNSFEQAAGVQRLSSLKLSFDAFAILAGDLLPTETGCVKSNTPGALGEYRNGALMVQALEASGITSGFTFDPLTQRYVAGTTAIKSPLGYATDGLLWEATVFWHWEGPCYHDPLWAPLFDSCVVQGLGGCTKSSKEAEEKADKRDDDDDDDDDDEDKKDSPPPPGDPPPPVAESDPGHTVTNTTVGGDNDTGRMFWREVVPEE